MNERPTLVRCATRANVLGPSDLTMFIRTAPLEALSITTEGKAKTPRIEGDQSFEGRGRKVRTIFKDVEKTLTVDFGPFEFAQLEVEVIRSARDFATLRGGLESRLGGYDDLPPLPRWVRETISVEKKKKKLLKAAGIGIASTSLVFSVLAATAVAAPLVALVGGSVVVGCAVGAAVQQDGGTDVIRSGLSKFIANVPAHHRNDDDDLWLEAVKHALQSSSHGVNDVQEAIAFFKYFLSHNGRSTVFQQVSPTPRRTRNHFFDGDDEGHSSTDRLFSRIWRSIDLDNLIHRRAAVQPFLDERPSLLRRQNAGLDLEKDKGLLRRSSRFFAETWRSICISQQRKKTPAKEDEPFLAFLYSYFE